jgi:hypothetical protein
MMRINMPGKRFFANFMINASIIILAAACSTSDVDYTPPPGSTETAITHYSFGKMVIDGKTYRSDVAILPGGKVSRWSFELSSHEIWAEHLRDFVSDRVGTIIIGTGFGGRAALTAPARDMIDKLKAEGVVVHIDLTSDAVQLYNASPKKGLLAFFHLNC